ncbi:unnamed protein product, partial [Linum tenue]
ANYLLWKAIYLHFGLTQTLAGSRSFSPLLPRLPYLFPSLLYSPLVLTKDGVKTASWFPDLLSGTLEQRRPRDVGGAVVRQSAKRSFIDLPFSPSPTTDCRSHDWILLFPIRLSIWKPDPSRPILSRSLSKKRQIYPVFYR